jgi:hypothetical protein
MACLRGPISLVAERQELWALQAAHIWRITMCILCASKPEGNPATACRSRVLQLLALLEHPDALQANLALRLGRQLLALTQPRRPALRCDAIASPATAHKQACRET